MKMTMPAAVSAAAGALLLLSACAGPDGSPAGASLGTITIDGESTALIESREYDAENDTYLEGYCTIGEETIIPGHTALVATADGRVVIMQYYDENNWFARLVTDHTSNDDVWRLDTETMKDNPLASGTAEISGQRAVVEGVWVASMESSETANVRLEIDCGAAN